MNVNHNFELVTPLEIKVVNVKSLAYNSVATVESTDFSKQVFEVVKTCDLTDSERKDYGFGNLEDKRVHALHSVA